jgi:hypothetical protein
MFCMPYFSSFIAFCAFVVTLFGACWCNFLTFTSNETVQNDDAVTLEFGIWFYRGWSSAVSSSGEVYVFESCYNYPEGTVYDANWKSAKAFNTMTLFIGLGGVVVSCALLTDCVDPSKRMFQIGGALNMVCSLFTGLSLLILDSNACNNNLNVALFEQAFPLLGLTFPDTCTMGVGAKTTITATVLWFVAAIAACMSGPTLPVQITADVASDGLVKEDLGPVNAEAAPDQAV